MTAAQQRYRAHGSGVSATASHLWGPASGYSTGGNVDLLIGEFARFINSEVALLCRLDGKGQPPAVICARGLGATHEPIARPREGGFVGRALRLPRAALEPLHSLLDPALVHATDPLLTRAAVAPIRLASGATAGCLIAGFQKPPHDPAQTLWVAESYAALIALCLYAPGSLNGLLAFGRRDRPRAA
jgi:hypothetical protein